MEFVPDVAHTSAVPQAPPTSLAIAAVAQSHDSSQGDSDREVVEGLIEDIVDEGGPSSEEEGEDWGRGF